MDDKPEDKKSLLQRLKDTIKEIQDLGGWEAFKSGDWLLNLIARSFRAYYLNSNAEYFRKKYPHASDDEIVKTLTSVAARNAAILGGLTGASVSANEISAFFTGTASGGLSLPVQISIVGSALAAEAVLLVRFQLQLIANIAKVHGAPLNPDDPEDVLLVLGIAVGGVGAEAFGAMGAKMAGHTARQFIRKKVSGTTLEAFKKFGARLGFKILQRSIIKYAVPFVSMVAGGGWNYATTRKVGGVASQHFMKIKQERSRRKASTPRKRTAPKKKAPATSRILQLNLHREFFDAIADGSKTVEYREYKPYWTKRLKSRDYDEIHFRNGYATNAPFMRVEYRGVEVEGRGASKQYAISLGRVLEVKRPRSN